MATHQIDLPEDLFHFAQSQVTNGRYVDVGDMVRDVLRDRQRAHDELDRLLLEGEASGLSGRTVEEIIADAKRRWHAHRPDGGR